MRTEIPVQINIEPKLVFIHTRSRVITFELIPSATYSVNGFVNDTGFIGMKTAMEAKQLFSNHSHCH